ncbi:MAG: 50S ribosomal protein L10 [Pseudomonadota bacterium]
MKRQKKEDVVAQLSKVLDEAQAVFVADFKGLSVGKMSELRRKIGQAGGEFQVAKNTLAKIAAKGTDAECISGLLHGNNGLGTTIKEPAAFAKALVEFAKTNDKFVIKGGGLGGRLLDFNQVKAMADLPPREVLLAMMLGAMNAVPGGFVRVLAAVPQKLVYALAAIRDSKESPAA